ncbi:DUF7848 domain-containing protein [Kitasatospora sp. NPDC004289]
MTQQQRFYAHFTLWSARLDLDPDAPVPVHLFLCSSEEEDGTVCGAQSVAATDFPSIRAWVYEHIAEHPGHRSLHHVKATPWLMVPETEPWPGPVRLPAHTACTPPLEDTDG